MKKLSKLFFSGLLPGFLSNVLLVSLLALSLTLTGCSSNSTDSSAQPSNPSQVTTTYSIIGKVVSATGQFNPNANMKLTLTNISTKEAVYTDAVGQMFAFQKIEAGFYEIRAEDRSNIYNTETVYKKIDQNIEELSMTLMTNTAESEELVFVTLKGRLIDETGNNIPFASITAKNSKTGQVVRTTTGFDNGSYTLELPVGNYEITYSKDSFEPQPVVLTITDKTTATFDGKTVLDFNRLPPVTLNYKLMKTGSIAGVLTGYVPGSKCDLYMTKSLAEKPGKLLTLTPKDNGYFFVKNLPHGFYCVTKQNPTVTPIVSGGDIVGYSFADGEEYFSWLEVFTDTTTPVPSAEQ